MKISFVTPFHNEEENAPLMLERIIEFGKKEKLEYEIIPVDDRSTDKTKEILSSFEKKYKFIKPLYRKDDNKQKGNTMGKALLEGSRKASGDYIIWTMGDLADNPSTYGEIIQKLNIGFDLVLASRYMKGGSRGDLDILKAFLSSSGTKLSRLMFGIPVYDITNAFRGFRKKILNQLEIVSSGFSISPEMVIKAYLAGYKISEVPTTYANRVRGVSSFKLLHMSWSYLFLYIKLFFQHVINRSSNKFTKNI